MIISGGFNVYPQMIEQAIYAHPAVQEVIVIGIPDDYRGEAAKAFVKLRAGAAPFTLEELRAFLAGKLGKHEMPGRARFRRRTAAHRRSASCRATNCATGSREQARLPGGCPRRTSLDLTYADTPRRSEKCSTDSQEDPMDLRFSKEEMAFREEVRDVLQEQRAAGDRARNWSRAVISPRTRWSPGGAS